MLDLRLYRVAFVPAVLAIIVAAFSLTERGSPALGTPLAPDAFDGKRAIAELRSLEAMYPDRRPGAPDDDRLATRVASELRQGGEFQVSTRRFEGQTAEGSRSLRSVVAVRTGLDERRILVLAHRDALENGSTASLSATAALLELARVFKVGRSLRKTLVLASVSGGSAGLAGARELAEHPGGKVVAVIVIGDVAGTNTVRPLVIPWSSGPGEAPPRFTDSIDVAVRQEVGLRPGGYSLPAKLMRLAFPLTLTEQGPFLEHGMPAATISASGELGPGAASDVSRKRLQSFGRATLRAVTALDAAPEIKGGATADLPVQRKLVPEWAVRLVVAALILPALFAAIDGVFRVRRRRLHPAMWVRWVLASALPFLLAALLAHALAITGLIPAPGAPAPDSAVPVDGAATAAMAAIVVTVILGWLGLRPIALRLAASRGDRTSNGAAAGTLLVLVLCVSAIWFGNPYMAGMLVLALHVFLLALEPSIRLPRAVLMVAMVVSLFPLGLIAVYYAGAFDYGAVQLAWTWLLLVAGGAIGWLDVVVWSVLAGAIVCAFLVVLRRGPGERPADPTTRGPLSYAGPGSLGGTESAMRR
jgi:hypothetical protein